MTKNEEGAACCLIYPDAHAWVLRNIRRIKPFSVRGQLGIGDVELLADAIAE